MAKHKASRDFRISMDNHITTMYLPIKFHVNWPKDKRIRASYFPDLKSAFLAIWQKNKASRFLKI